MKLSDKLLIWLCVIFSVVVFGKFMSFVAEQKCIQGVVKSADSPRATKGRPCVGLTDKNPFELKN